MLEFTKHHKYFNQMVMVAKCVKKESTRYALSHIEVNEKHIVGTDGRRLACLDNFGIEVGRYKPVKITKAIVIIDKVETEGNFPKYEDIIPDISKASLVNLDAPDGAWTLPNQTKAILSYNLYKLNKRGVCIYSDFLVDFLACDGFYVLEPKRPVVFVADKFTGVIMPMSI